VFGQLAPNVYSACVQNGVGCARGTYQGELAADLVMGNDHELLRTCWPMPGRRRCSRSRSGARQGAFLWLEWLSRGER
jgi:hypothetical protein